MPEQLMARCLVCADLLSYERESAEPLIAHLQERHPYIHVARIPVSASADELINPDISDGRDKSCKLKEVQNQCASKTVRRSTSCPVRTSLNPGKVFCPACKKLEAPVIRRKKKFNGNEGISICYMLGCWPLCFLPYLMQSDRMFDVYCRHCSYLIGRYDKKMNTVMSRPVAKPVTDRKNATQKLSSSHVRRKR